MPFSQLAANSLASVKAAILSVIRRASVTALTCGGWTTITDWTRGNKMSYTSQVLVDNDYFYPYDLGDALDSVRQLVDGDGKVYSQVAMPLCAGSQKSIPDPHSPDPQSI
jgi:hypothetical protein